MFISSCTSQEKEGEVAHNQEDSLEEATKTNQVAPSTIQPKKESKTKEKALIKREPYNFEDIKDKFRYYDLDTVAFEDSSYHWIAEQIVAVRTKKANF